MTPQELFDLLAEHEYRFGFDTNCSCGAPSIWYWDDYRQHLRKLVRSRRWLTVDGL